MQFLEEQVSYSIVIKVLKAIAESNMNHDSRYIGHRGANRRGESLTG